MSEMPKNIWAWYAVNYLPSGLKGTPGQTWHSTRPLKAVGTEYIRADIAAAEKRQAVREALERALRISEDERHYPGVVNIRRNLRALIAELDKEGRE